MVKKSIVDSSTGEVLSTFAKRPHFKPKVMAVGDGRTKSEFAKSCDLKERVRIYQERGILPGMRAPFGAENAIDTTMYPDSYHEALNLVSRVGQHFAALPSETRTKFHNNPQLYLADMEARQKASKEAAVKAAGIAKEAMQYDLEDKVAAGRAKASARDKRVQEALKEPSVSPSKEG